MTENTNIEIYKSAINAIESLCNHYNIKFEIKYSSSGKYASKYNQLWVVKCGDIVFKHKDFPKAVGLCMRALIERKGDAALFEINNQEMSEKMDSDSSKPSVIPNQKDYSYLSDWLNRTEKNLVELGYRKYSQDYKGEDFCYWKTFYGIDGKEIYQVGVLFYDFRKHIAFAEAANRIGIQYDCMLLNGSRIDLSVGKEIDLPEFESMAKVFYESMKQYV